MCEALEQLGAMVALLFMTASIFIGAYVVLAYGVSIVWAYTKGVCR